VTSALDGLRALLDLETIDPGLYRGRQPQTQRQRVFGGQVIGQALVAAGLSVEGRAVHSLHGYFLRPGDGGAPIVYSVEPTRDGRSFSLRRVVARQHGQVIFSLSASFQVEEVGFEHADPMPDVGDVAPEDCVRLVDAMSRTVGPSRAQWMEEWGALDVRLAGGDEPAAVDASAAHVGRDRVWMRVDGTLPDDRLLHQSLLAYASDLTLMPAMLMPHRDEVATTGLVAASLDHAVWFHRPFRADEWLLYDQVSPAASGGRGFALGRIFTQDGRLVASVAQEGMMRPNTRGTGVQTGA
jgi:acyl-CoA thioesterase-2